MFKAHRVINLDFAEEDRVVVGSCGGTGMKVRLLIQREEIVKENGKAWEISITGMHGGHSGEDIDKGSSETVPVSS